MIADVLVIGGGPAGLMAAGTAARSGKNVILAEKNSSLGKKLLITGKGRCNVTNDADISDFFDNIVNNSRFLYSAFYGFTNKDVMNFFESYNVPLKVERGKRVFPESDRSYDILCALKKYCEKVSVINKKVVGLMIDNGEIIGAELEDKEKIYCKSVVVSTGGLSYPKTGSTGDGYRFAKNAGHTVTDLSGALVPLVLEGEYPKMLEGLSLKNVKVTLYQNDKEIYSDFGEMVFTNDGVSGPVILSLSSYVTDGGEGKLSIDLKPALSEKTLEQRIILDFNKYINKNFINSLSDLCPKKLIPVIVEMSGISPDKKVNVITKEERKKLENIFKNMEFGIIRKGNIEDAIITAGGVNVKEINPKTMESKIVKGLYFAGEIIDVHGYTGGYNLQIAFSTGYCAGENC